MPKQATKSPRTSSKTAAKKHTKMPLVDRATYVVAIIEPIITIPQAADIFIHHTAAGISLTSWIGYEILTVVWIWYAYVHRNKLIMIYNLLYFVVQTVIIFGGIMYGARW
jgi:uncharacterized protein with PQ loop repeat